MCIFEFCTGIYIQQQRHDQKVFNEYYESTGLAMLGDQEIVRSRDQHRLHQHHSWSAANAEELKAQLSEDSPGLLIMPVRCHSSLVCLSKGTLHIDQTNIRMVLKKP